MVYDPVRHYAMLNDVYEARLPHKTIADNHGYSPAYISQVTKKFFMLRNPPKTNIDGELICWKCDTRKERLVFHHNHRTGEHIALVCFSCNLKIGENNENYMTKDHRKCQRELYDLKQGWNRLVRLIEDGHLVEDKMREYDLKWLTSEVNRL